MYFKRIITILVAFVLVLQTLMPSSFVTTVKAASSDITNQIQFLTGVKVTDKDGNDISGSIDENYSVKLNYTWEIKDEDNVESGDYYIINLPKGVKISEDITKDIMDQHGNKIADLYVYKNGELKFIFTDYVNDNKAIKGEMFVECGFNKEEIENGKIEFEVNGSSETIVIDFKNPAKKISLEQEGIYNGDGTVTWTVKVNKEKDKIVKGARLTNEIKKEGLEYHNYIKGSESINNGTQGEFEYDEDTKSLIYIFDEESESEYTITFKTEIGLGIHNGGIILVENKLEFENDKEISKDTDIITITLGDIQKSGVYDWHENKIDWTITVNKQNKNLKNVIVKDILSEELMLNKSSVKVEPTLQGSNYTYNDSTRELKYSLGDINKEYTIKFSTYINLPENQENTEKHFVKNIAELEVDNTKHGESGIELEIPVYVIRKNFINYSPSTGEITWSISVNETSSSLKNAYLTDDILTGQKYVEDSFTLHSKQTNEDKFDKSKFTYDNTINSERTGNISYDFGNINEPYYITFKTKIVDYSDPIDIIKAFTNKAILYFNDRYHTGHDEYVISNKTLLKEGIDYDFINKIVTWRIKLNQNRFPITNAVITDDIPNGQEYVKDSFKISPNANGQLEHDLASGDDLEKLTYTFNEKISDIYEIEFQTKITDLTIFEEGGTKKVHNEAFLTGDEIDIKMASIAEMDVENPLVKKSFNYEEGNDFIDWYVEGNTENKPIKGATIEDNLQDGLILETDTIKLNKLELEYNGNYVLGEEVALTSDNVNYDVLTNKFVFTFGSDFEGPFKLSFRTKVTKAGSYKNTVIFKGSSNESSTTEETKVGGWGDVEKGSIKIIKVDSNDENKTLKGATFQIVDKYNNILETSKPTEDDGVAIFKELKYDVEYYIKELTSPEGYDKSNEAYKFILKNNEKERNIEYKFKNSKTPIVIPEGNGSILINKINESKQNLEGVEFTLYDDKDNVIKVQKTNNYGLVEFKNLPYGNYIVKETKELPGYKPLDKDLKVEVSEKNKWVFVGTIINEKLKGEGSLLLRALDENKEFLEGVEFTLYDENKKVLTVLRSNSIGLVEFKNLPYGKYIVKQTKALLGYNMYTEELKGEVTKINKHTYIGAVTNIKTK